MNAKNTPIKTATTDAQRAAEHRGAVLRMLNARNTGAAAGDTGLPANVKLIASANAQR